MKTVELVVLLVAPLGTGLAAFDYASGWDQPAVVANSTPPERPPVCPEPAEAGEAAAPECTRVTSASSQPQPAQAGS